MHLSYNLVVHAARAYWPALNGLWVQHSLESPRQHAESQLTLQAAAQIRSYLYHLKWFSWSCLYTEFIQTFCCFLEYDIDTVAEYSTDCLVGDLRSSSSLFLCIVLILKSPTQLRPNSSIEPSPHRTKKILLLRHLHFPLRCWPSCTFPLL